MSKVTIDRKEEGWHAGFSVFGCKVALIDMSGKS